MSTQTNQTAYTALAYNPDGGSFRLTLTGSSVLDVLSQYSPADIFPKLRDRPFKTTKAMVALDPYAGPLALEVVLTVEFQDTNVDADQAFVLQFIDPTISDMDGMTAEGVPIQGWLDTQADA